MKKVAINGFGRIGRAYFRLAHTCKDIQIVAINDLADCEDLAYLLKYDSVYGKFSEDVRAGDKELHVGNKKIPIFSIKSVTELPWRALGVDTVIESTGVLTSYEKAYTHIIAGAKHVIITAPVKDAPPDNIEADTVLIGVNTDRARVCTLTSNASCTTNAVGIPLSILEKSVGIESAILNTVHGYTATQQLVDGQTKKKGNMRFGRAAATNIIPSSTGAAIATTKALSSLEGRFDGIALRVPTVAGSIVDLTLITKKITTVKEINDILKKNENDLFTTTTEPIVSSDVLGEPYVSIADLSLTRVVNGRLAKIMLWYDNEMGYTQSLIEHTRNT